MVTPEVLVLIDHERSWCRRSWSGRSWGRRSRSGRGRARGECAQDLVDADGIASTAHLGRVATAEVLGYGTALDAWSGSFKLNRGTTEALCLFGMKGR